MSAVEVRLTTGSSARLTTAMIEEPLQRLFDGIGARTDALAMCVTEGHVEKAHPKYGRMCARCLLVLEG